jgi:fumarate hydratase class II
MGEMKVPKDALYGASTQRAVLNFPISGHPMPEKFIQALGLMKWACAKANETLGLLSARKSKYIQRAAREIAEGKLSSHFPVDVFQTGSGTSSNMNANEVIANRASQLARQPIGSKKPVHPNDDVNLGQSSNDIIPSALHLSVALSLKENLLPALNTLTGALQKKSKEWKHIIKIGRTHLMDATPITLGQEFSGYARQIEKSVERASISLKALQELAVGGTAVGTGINSHPRFAAKVCQSLTKKTGIRFREAKNHFEAQAGRDDCVQVAGHLTTIAASLTKISNDVRLLASGPRAGLGEISLPATQPGSSIMPGKVNPVMCEMLVQVCSYATGLSNTVVLCGRDGHFELNVNIPLIAYSLHESITCLSNGIEIFTKRCINEMQAHPETCQHYVEKSLMLVTALNPHIGYDKAAAIAKQAFTERKTLREVLLEKKILTSKEVDQILDPRSMI